MKWVLFAMYMTTVGPVDVVDPTSPTQQWDTAMECSDRLVQERKKLIEDNQLRYLVCEPLMVRDVLAAREEHALKFQQSVTF